MVMEEQVCRDHKERTERLEDTIFGNGRQGLISDVAQVKVTLKIILSINLLMLGAIAKMLFFGG
jgi:hypothetical protein